MVWCDVCVCDSLSDSVLKNKNWESFVGMSVYVCVCVGGASITLQPGSFARPLHLWC